VTGVPGCTKPIFSYPAEINMKRIPLLALVLLAAIPLLAAEPLAAPWKHQDIGEAKTPGTAEQADGAITLAGSMDIWGVADGCQFASQPIHGDAELMARVTAIDNPGGVAHAKASLCIRESVDPGAKTVTMCVTAADGTQFLYRDKTGEKTTHFVGAADAPKSIVPKAKFPCWLKIARHGNDISGYESADGKTWQIVGQVNLELPADGVIGLAASSHKPDVLTKVTFDNVKLAGPAAATPAKP
jgi:large repetitive protein